MRGELSPTANLKAAQDCRLRKADDPFRDYANDSELRLAIGQSF
jgi:hypothetical protein